MKPITGPAALVELPGPTGRFTVIAQQGGITHVVLPNQTVPSGAGEPTSADTELAAKAAAQLAEYFAGERQDFDLPLAPTGSEFQRRVWAALDEIEYGQTKSYGEIGTQVETVNAHRAVGAAIGANPVPILLPCHRVISSSGRLTGYAGGLELKRALLDLEDAHYRED